MKFDTTHFEPIKPIAVKILNDGRHLNKSSAVAKTGDRGHTTHGRKEGGCCDPFAWRAGSPSNKMWPGPRSTSVPSDVFIHPAVWPQYTWTENWGLCPFGGGGVGSPSNIMWPGPKPTCMPRFILIHLRVWPQYTKVTATQTGQRSGSTGRTVLQTVAQKPLNRHISRVPELLDQSSQNLTRLCILIVFILFLPTVKMSDFYSAPQCRNARIASAVLAIAILSVCPSVTRRYSVKNDCT